MKYIFIIIGITIILMLSLQRLHESDIIRNSNNSLLPEGAANTDKIIVLLKRGRSKFTRYMNGTHHASSAGTSDGSSGRIRKNDLLHASTVERSATAANMKSTTTTTTTSLLPSISSSINITPAHNTVSEESNVKEGKTASASITTLSRAAASVLLKTPELSTPYTSSAAGLSNLNFKVARYAYVTLLHGIDKTLKYKGFLLNTLVMKAALTKLGSKHDLIALVGYTDLNLNTSEFQNDINLLLSSNIIVHYLPRMTKNKGKITFAEMALLKITPWSFTDYDKLQFFDGDILPTKNLDCFFQLKENTFNTGSASPLNSGWYLAIPDLKMYNDLWTLSLQRLSQRWNETTGWGSPIPKNGLFYRNSLKAVDSWNFNGASLDQGLLTYYLVMHHGNVTLLDVNRGRKFKTFFRPDEVSLNAVLSCCGGLKPVDHFSHFTGRNKPWLQDLATTRDKNLVLWGHLLDSLKLPINSQNIFKMGFKSPLGYFHPNK